ncbi:MAG: patatin-like phospholipase family protein [Acidimicrobiales bacterium]
MSFGGDTGVQVPDPALPRSFEARYGRGVRHGICLGGGGTFFVAWQIGYLHALAKRGLPLDEADRLVGTSAGSLVAAVLAHGDVERMYLESEALSLTPSVMTWLFPSDHSTPSQQEALKRYEDATSADTDTIRAIGKAALAATAPSRGRMTRDLTLVVGERWDSDALWMTCVDADTGERCVITHETRVPVDVGAAASSAVPGIYAPQTIAGRPCMDGGVSGTATHLDLLAGSERALVLSLYRDPELPRDMLTLSSGDLSAEVSALGGSDTQEGNLTRVFFQAPDHPVMTVDELMSPKSVKDALRLGDRQGDEDYGRLREFWG